MQDPCSSCQSSMDYAFMETTESVGLLHVEVGHYEYDYTKEER